MPAMNDAKKEIIALLKNAFGKAHTPSVSDLATPPDPKMGDVSFPCFSVAKGMKRNPAEIATEVAAKLAPKGLVKDIRAVGPYVNFTLSDAFGSAVLEDIEKTKAAYGTSDAGASQKVMVEYAQPNTHKEIHVGHLRNFVVGHMVVNVLRAAGFDVIPTSYINDLGMHVATCLWALKKDGDAALPEDADAVRYLGAAYAKGAAAATDDPEVKAEISRMFQNLEQLKGPDVALWKKTRKWSLKSIEAVFKELKLPIDVWYYESDLVRDTRRIIDDLIKRGIATRSEGAWIVDLSKDSLGANLLVKSDGTLLYNAKDLALAAKKEANYAPAWSIYVIDVRQSLAMRQLFRTLELAGSKKKLTHLSYEFVTLPEGAMASRKGNIIRYETFRDAMFDMARTETKTRHPDWSGKKIETTARAVAFSALRFGMLRQDLDKKIVFDMKEALSFDGCTGPYLLYAYARIASVLRKAGKHAVTADASRLTLPVEHRLLFGLGAYPQVVLDTARDFSCGRVAQYLFDLAKTFAEFYEAASVLQASDEKIAAARLGLCRAVRDVLKNGLSLMGIETVEEM